MKIIILILLFVVLLMSYFVFSPSKKILIGYFVPNKDDKLSRLELQTELNTLSIVVYAFLHVAKDDKVHFSFSELSSFQGITTPIKKLISVGGADNPYDFFYSINNIDNFVNSVADVINKFHLSGVDLDFEIDRLYTLKEANEFAELIAHLRQKIGSGKIISMTSIINPSMINSIGANNWKTIAKNINYLSIMCYDIASANSKPIYTQFVSNLYTIPQAPQQLVNAGLSCDQSIKLLVIMGVPKSKIILGVPAYAHSYGGVSATNNGLYQLANPMLTPTFDDMGKGLLRYATVLKLKQKGFIEHTILLNGDVIGVWSYNPTQHQFITYDNPKSIQVKLNYVLKNNLAGMMLWRVGQDVPINNSDSLLKALSSI